MKNNKGIASIVIILIVVVALAAGGYYYWSKKSQKQVACTEEAKICSDGSSVGRVGSKCEFAECPEEKEIGPTAVYGSPGIAGWQKCTTLDCITGVMEQTGASSEAINFTVNFSAFREPQNENDYGIYGYLEKFQEMGKVDLGIITYPDRANTNSEYCLLNGSPSVIFTAIDKDEFQSDMKQSVLYSEAKAQNLDIDIWPLAPKFLEKKVLSNGNEEYVFEYSLINGCRICRTVYSANIGFDFDANGIFLKTRFIGISKNLTDI